MQRAVLYLRKSLADFLFRSCLPHRSMEESNFWLSKMINSKETNGITDFVIMLRKDEPQPDSVPRLTNSLTASAPVRLPRLIAGPVIGKIGIWKPLESSKSGEIGFLLHGSYHRRGLMSEALSALVGYLFEWMDVEVITTDVDPRNEACIGMLQKHGFVLTSHETRTWLNGSEWMDSDYLTLTQDIWKRRRGSQS